MQKVHKTEITTSFCDETFLVGADHHKGNFKCCKKSFEWWWVLYRVRVGVAGLGCYHGDCWESTECIVTTPPPPCTPARLQSAQRHSRLWLKVQKSVLIISFLHWLTFYCNQMSSTCISLLAKKKFTVQGRCLMNKTWKKRNDQRNNKHRNNCLIFLTFSQYYLYLVEEGVGWRVTTVLVFHSNSFMIILFTPSSPSWVSNEKCLRS